MRLAICFSGNGACDATKNVESHRVGFDGDFFFGAWEDQASLLGDQLPGTDILSMPDVKMHYHPVLDVVVPSLEIPHLPWIQDNAKNIPGNRNYVKGWHRTKQHLAHATLVESLPPEYDLIVRSRYDTKISDKVDFQPYLSRAYDEGIAIGFGKALGQKWAGDRRGYSFDAFMPSQNHPPNYMSDFLIIHRRDMFDPAKVWDLHDKKELLPAEMGWWQLLSEPYGGHANILGGATLQRFK